MPILINGDWNYEEQSKSELESKLIWIEFILFLININYYAIHLNSIYPNLYDYNQIG